MTVARQRSSSPAPSSQVSKRLKTAHAHTQLSDAAAQSHFASGLFDDQAVQQLKSSYSHSKPFKHVIVEKLFQDDLLTKVKDECIAELSFTEKETDIYKVHQTGDLASLSYLPESELSRLKSIHTLRDALYSKTFRNFVRNVTGCRALSGTKTDMSVNTYRQGCHLLNHDDVIGTRRVSYILYMPLPPSQEWQREWGGALELYPVKLGPDGIDEPEPIPVKSIPPSWNQFIFFEVQPGKSFHSVQEVVVGEREDERQRLSISGWFHAPQEGEEGYEPEPPAPQSKSSLEQLTSSSTAFNSYPSSLEPLLPDAPLSEADIMFLSLYLNPIYLQPRTLKALTQRFIDESSLELHDFLHTDLAEKLKAELRQRDKTDGLSDDRCSLIPSHAAGVDDTWVLKGPPHKLRHCALSTPADPVSHYEDPSIALTNLSSDDILRKLQDSLFPSLAFRAWLAHVSSLLPLRHAVEARRFRPALDYTLATSEESEARLDVVLGLTPPAVIEEKSKGKMQDEEEDVGWANGRWGGWECYMAPHDGDEDPAVYRSGPSKKAATDTEPSDMNADESSANGAAAQSPNDDQDDDDPMEDDADGTLLTVQPGFNRLLLVLRDEGVMHFVKYVSAAATGSRWDVCGEFEVGKVQEDSDGE
ncbi:hypothetical protein BD410DRAFT_736691 [Rickenella mellea]|uniref:uS12 prolyl 3,4-dihydroxylase n=1 Tax=Rickenella mellea TaxID=50990 RepID=A0A4R5XHB5_9AGAM|nr:hypothetical protein BD410DRAFT_736691 [Rickenella mellea]